MALPQYFLQELKMRSDISDVASAYVNLKRRGKNLIGLCPFHNEKTPSFNIYPENGSFYCFGCSAGGDVITFVERIENLDYLDAVRFLAQRAGLAMPEDGVDDTMSKLRTRVLEINRETARFFHSALLSPKGKAGLDYFQRRGLSMKTIKHFGLGYSPEGGFELVNHLKAKGYTANELVQANVAGMSRNGNPYDRFRSRVMFPIIDLRGNVVAFGGRILTDEKPKYINTSDTPVYHKSSGLFAMNFAKDAGSRQLILAEGYMDVISLHAAGFQTAIASLGTSLTEEQARILKRYADEVVICYDSDAAGQRATQRAIPILKNAGLFVKVLTVPGNKDPDEFMRTYGADGPIRFKQLLEACGNDVEYRLAKLRAEFDVESSDGKVKYLNAALPVIAAIGNRIERDVYAGKLSQETGAGKDAILSMADRQAADLRKKQVRQEHRSYQEVQAVRSVANSEKKEHLRAAQAEEGIIAYLFQNADKADWLGKRMPPEKFVTAFGRRVYAILLGKTIYGDVSLMDFSGELTNAEMSDLARITSGENGIPPTWEDVEKYIRILESEGGYSSPETIKNASEEDLKQYMDNLRKQKIGGNE